MKVKTAELSGVALDWAVAKCENFKFGEGSISLKDDMVIYRTRSAPWGYFCPHHSWAQGGPIIDREKINLIDKPFLLGTKHAVNGIWMAYQYGSQIEERKFGHTMLVAAMRFYVASKLGEEIEVPDELLNAKQ